jgi:hypothetical protein
MPFQVRKEVSFLSVFDMKVEAFRQRFNRLYPTILCSH